MKTKRKARILLIKNGAEISPNIKEYRKIIDRENITYITIRKGNTHLCSNLLNRNWHKVYPGKISKKTVKTIFRKKIISEFSKSEVNTIIPMQNFFIYAALRF
jgi:hypothetical protein